MAINKMKMCTLDLSMTCNEFQRLENDSLDIIEEEFDNLCQNFSTHPSTPTNNMSKSQSTVPLFASDSSYGFSEFCDKYKDKDSSMKVGLTELETEGKSCRVESIETLGKQQIDMTSKTSPKNSTFRYCITIINTPYSQCTSSDPKQRRNDVALKSGIRAIRRHFKNKFKQQNIRLMRKRLCNVKNCEIVKQVLKMISETLPQEQCTNQLAKYIIGVCKLKPIKKFRLNDDLIDDINLFLNCAKQYSYTAFSKLVRNHSFQILCNVVDRDIIPDCLRQEIEKTK